MIYLLFLCVSSSLLAGDITNSIVPTVTALENETSLSPHKYSAGHYREISEALRCIDQKLRIASFNMLFDIRDAQLDPENRWPKRLPRIVQVLETMQADVIGCQELQKHQIEELLERIGDVYSFVFIPNFDPNQTSSQDYDGILYRKERLKLLESKVFSVTLPKKNALITMGHFLDIKTGKEFSHFNVHLPSWNATEQEHVAIELAAIITPLQRPVVLTGDLNTIPSFADLTGLPWYGGERIAALLEKANLKNTLNTALTGHVGPIASLTNVPQGTVGFVGHGTPGVICDHIFISKEFKAVIHAVDPVQVDGHFPSDHMPVFADVIYTLAP